MSMHRAVLSILAILAGVPLARVWAQTPAPGQSAPPPTGTAPVASGDGWGITGVAVVVMVVGLLVIVGALVKTLDLKRKREAEALHLQAQISDALLRETALFGLPVTPTAHAPLWSGSPVTIELAGQVPTPELRDSVLRIAKEEAGRVRQDFRIEDRIGVVPAMQPAAGPHRAA
jgi:hypothetical protein